MAKLPVSPLAPSRLADLPEIEGVTIATHAAEIRYKGREDVLLMSFCEGTSLAGVFTRSQVPGHPVTWSRQRVAGGQARALLVNAGNANVFCGDHGEEVVRRSAAALSKALGVEEDKVFLASTGVIGEPLPIERLEAAVEVLSGKLGPGGWDLASQAIMTTDTFPKRVTTSCRIGDKSVTLNGIAKGSGMIQPDMATMLAFIATDARLPAALLQAMLSEACDQSFNATTVDSDTSTSDTLLLFATGKSDSPLPSGLEDPLLREFRSKLKALCVELAQLVVRDGEGAQKFIEVVVTGAQSNASARRIGLVIANSPLVKTAIAGEDANWGRVAMAVGKSGEWIDASALSVSFGGITIAERGGLKPGYDEAPVAEHLKGREIKLSVDVGVGEGYATVWTCDLTHGYIDINADYRS